MFQQAWGWCPESRSFVVDVWHGIHLAATPDNHDVPLSAAFGVA